MVRLSPQVPPLPKGQERQRQDLIHQHVLYVLRKQPELQKRRVQQVAEGVYLIDGQEVSVEWQHAVEPRQRGHLVVVDGPMRQPLVDYLGHSEENKDFDIGEVQCTTSLHQVPKEKRMTFDDKHKKCPPRARRSRIGREVQPAGGHESGQGAGLDQGGGGGLRLGRQAGA